jgi:1-acyl-sn-glycerol-3-phosphate acyltransferase
MEAERLRRDVSRDISPRYWLFRRVMLALGWLFLGFTVHGAGKVPKDGPLIVAMAVPRRIQWMAKKELYVFPFVRFFYFIGTFPVDRQKGGRAALKTALNLLAAGWALGIFPEGTRRKSYNPEDAPKSGVAMLASRGGVPVLPVFVDRVPGLLERLRGGKLHIYIGDPITPDNKTRERRARREIAEEVLRAIYALDKSSGVAL